MLDDARPSLYRMSSSDASLDHARQLDAADPLAGLRARFHAPLGGAIYLDGNSLGLLSRDAEASVRRVLDEWKTLAIGGWLDAQPPWFTMAEELAARVAAVVGAQPGEVAVTNSTTVNLHQLLATLYRPGPRPKVLAFADEFPSDLYALASHLRLRGRDPARDLVLVPAGDNGLIDEQIVLRAWRDDPEIGLAVLPAVVYTTGQLLDVPALAASAREAGVCLGLDLSHSVGVVPHALSEDGVDFAFWCHYKYLNAGPGAVGGLFLNARHEAHPPGMAGWWGAYKGSQFDMAREMTPARGAAGLQVGTPPVLGMAALEGALTLTETAGMDRVREKSLRLTAYLMAQLEARLPWVEEGFRFANPWEDQRRGGHVALVHREAARLCRALRDAGVITDFRAPDIVRFAPVPLYNSFADCHGAVERLRAILSARSYENYPLERALVP